MTSPYRAAPSPACPSRHRRAECHTAAEALLDILHWGPRFPHLPQTKRRRGCPAGKQHAAFTWSSRNGAPRRLSAAAEEPEAGEPRRATSLSQEPVAKRSGGCSAAAGRGRHRALLIFCDTNRAHTSSMAPHGSRAATSRLIGCEATASAEGQRWARRRKRPCAMRGAAWRGVAGVCARGHNGFFFFSKYCTAPRLYVTSGLPRAAVTAPMQREFKERLHDTLRHR